MEELMRERALLTRLLEEFIAVPAYGPEEALKEAVSRYRRLQNKLKEQEGC